MKFHTYSRGFRWAIGPALLLTAAFVFFPATSGARRVSDLSQTPVSAASGTAVAASAAAGRCVAGTFTVRGGLLDAGSTGALHGSSLSRGPSIGFLMVKRCTDDASVCEADRDCANHHCDPTCDCNGDTSCDISGPTNQRYCATTLAPCSTNAECAPGVACAATVGPPLPLTVGGYPTCIVSTFDAPFTGTADTSTGAAAAQVDLRWRIFFGETLARPCPRCGTPAQSPEVGQQYFCEGGQTPGAVCTVEGVTADFGGTSNDCAPLLSSNLSGSGAVIRIREMTTGTIVRTAALPCKGASFTSNPLNGTGTCLDNDKVTCSSNADCTRCTADPTTVCTADAQCAGKGKCAQAPAQPVSCGFWCQCGFCDDNPSLPCFATADCPAGQACQAGTGVSSDANAPQQRPNDCQGDKFICGMQGKEACATTMQGRCTLQDFRACSIDADCPSGTGPCAYGPLPCFESRITRTGAASAFGMHCLNTSQPCSSNVDCGLEGSCLADTSAPQAVGLFCAPPVTNQFDSAFLGFLGPGAVRLDGFMQICRCGDPACSELCNNFVCGNATTEPGEECDDGNLVSGDGCDDNCTVTACGNGVITAGEACDDGNASNSDSCTNDCKIAVCGDGLTRVFLEQCDDANSSNTDSCTNSCETAFCGDGFIHTGVEECDDGNGDYSDSCSNFCTIAVCGDGIVQPGQGETCDDANTVNTDACSNACKLAACGDGILQSGRGEICDDGNSNDGDGCDSNCTVTACGNGVVTGDEQCDDGNQSDIDACSTDCKSLPGCALYVSPNVPRQIPDLGTAVSTLTIPVTQRVRYLSVARLRGLHTFVGDLRFELQNPSGAAVTLIANICSGSDNFDVSLADEAPSPVPCPPTDGAVHKPMEALAGLLGGSMNGTWTLSVADMAGSDSGTLQGWGLLVCKNLCGDGIVQAAMGETCDDGNTVNTDGCSADCQTAFCGDGIAQPFLGETCDDGNAVNTDACSTSCHNAVCGDGIVQPSLGETCDDANVLDGDGCPADCKAIIGDGLVDLGEACDDGNRNSGDGCDAGGQIEECYTCSGQPSVCTPGARIRVVDASSNTVGRFAAATLGADGLAVVVYYDDTNQRIKVAHCEDAACTNATISVVDSNVGDPGAWQHATGIAIGGDGLPVLSYYHAASMGLKVAHCQNVACTASTTLTVASGSSDQGPENSIAIGTNGFPVVTYGDIGADQRDAIRCFTADCSLAIGPMMRGPGARYGHTTVGGDGLALTVSNSHTIYATHCDDDYCSAVTSTAVVTTASGVPWLAPTAIATMPNGLAMFTYHQGNTGMLRLARCNNAACDSVAVSTIDSNVGVSTETVASTSIAFAADGTARFAYWDTDDGDLKLARCTGANCGSFSRVSVDTAGNVGRYASMVLSAGKPLIAYYDTTAQDLKVAYCAGAFGNGVVDPGEDCDDGNFVNGDGCNDRGVYVCGDGELTAGEQCDDGNTVNGDGCDSACVNETCGNGKVQTGEECDDGNTIDLDRCTSNCRNRAGCAVYLSSDVPKNIPLIGTVTSTLTIPAAGKTRYLSVVGLNGTHTYVNDLTFELTNPSGTRTTVINRLYCDKDDFSLSLADEATLFPPCPPTDGETHLPSSALAGLLGGSLSGVWTLTVNDLASQDKGTLKGWGLLACDSLCGDGFRDGAESCDDGNTIDTDACISACRIATCGDGIVRSGVEGCDDANTVNTDACSNACTVAVCGDGIVQASLGETCDDGNTISGDGCDGNCTVTACGNGVATGAEQCDDGNLINTDSCTASCRHQPGCALYVSSDVPRQIPDMGAVASTLTVPAAGTTRYLSVVRLRGLHTYVSDLRFELRNPSGTKGRIIEEICGGSQDFDLSLADEALTSIPCPPTDAAVHQPNAALAALLGGPMNGVWTLSVSDVEIGDSGTLQGWGLLVCKSACGDGTQEGTEACDDGNAIDTDGCTNSCTIASCGDGVVRAGIEVCDDGNGVNTDGCSNACTLAACGDGIVQPGRGETCDDANTVNTDACSNACTLAACGDGIVQQGRGEICDDANTVNTDACSNVCKVAACGDGIVQPGNGETCDDANTVNTDACSNACTLAACGDGIVQQGRGEICDDANTVNTDACSNTCTVSVCGDGIVQPGNGETCDDANTVNTDACSNACKVAMCGDEIVQPGNGESCDDANTDNTDGCSNGCKLAVCGDGIIQAALGEACDDGNTVNTDACTNACKAATCSDGIIQPGNGESCDDANSIDTDACTTLCKLATCGDGIVQGVKGETCDDANSVNTDACTNACRSAVCGDGITQPVNGESCDDANSVATDGCTNLCKLAACGDGIVRAGVEQCDDGNSVEVDACTNACKTAVCGDNLVQPGLGETCDDGNAVDTDACTNLCQAVKCGDASRDGKVLAGDALQILRQAVGTATRCADAPCVCDVNGDSNVKASDALLALKAAVGQPADLRCAC